MLRRYLYSEKSKGLYFKKIVSKNASDTAIIFLHGLAGSFGSWGEEYQTLSSHATLYFVDLLGYGFSAKPDISYTLDAHIKALKQWIDEEVPEQRIILVGHSLGALISLGYAAAYPQRIIKVFLLALPYYTSEAEARLYVARSSKFTFIFSDSLVTKVVCTMLCSIFGSVTRQISPLFMRDLPRTVAQDVHRHSYQSYISTLTNVIYQQNIPELLKKGIIAKVHMIHGEKDTVAPVENIQKLAGEYSINVQVLEGEGHRFPLDKEILVIPLIKNNL